ncbi:MAG: hypothetical protein WED04_09715 [Promethearchaeati archaeon SRVP18_Atabeyarchaeia-1]
MNRKTASILALLATLLVCSTIVAPSTAADYSKIGVKVGDRADYSIQYAECDRLRVEVTEVTGTFVNLTLTYHWSNGTVVDLIHYAGNVSSGDLADAVVCGGLQAGDPLWQGGYLFFSSTVNLEIAGEMRTVNDHTDGGSHYYFDQETGILAKAVAPGGSNYTMISTNMWGAANPMVLILIGGGAAVIALVAAIAVLVSRRRK